MSIKLTIRPATGLRLRAAAAVLALVLGWLAVPLTLAAWEPDVCEMECCVTAGHCCCATRHAYVAGRLPEPGEVTINFETELTAPCPATCAGATSSAQTNLPRARHAAAAFVTVVVTPLQYGGKLNPSMRSFAAQTSTPRAPPLGGVLSA